MENKLIQKKTIPTGFFSNLIKMLKEKHRIEREELERKRAIRLDTAEAIRQMQYQKYLENAYNSVMEKIPKMKISDTDTSSEEGQMFVKAIYQFENGNKHVDTKVVVENYGEY